MAVARGHEGANVFGSLAVFAVGGGVPLTLTHLSPNLRVFGETHDASPKCPNARPARGPGLWHAPAVPTTLSFAPSLSSLLHGSRVVLVVGPASVFAGELPA